MAISWSSRGRYTDSVRFHFLKNHYVSSPVGATFMETIAQTNLQLYNQLIETGRDSVELEVIRRTYDFATTIYPGYYQADGKPFVAHSVGVASILAHLDMPAEFIATGLLHNIYGNGDFGDGLQNVLSSSRRNLVRNSVGNQIEALVFRFRSFRILPESIERLANGIDAFNRTDRNLLLVDLADYLEKYVDLGTTSCRNLRSFGIHNTPGTTTPRARSNASASIVESFG